MHTMEKMIFEEAKMWKPENRKK